MSVVPVLGLQDGDYVASMRRGLLLEWMLAPGDCQKCSASGGHSDGMGFSCKCPNGVRNPMSCVAGGEYFASSMPLALGHETTLMVHTYV